MTCCRALYGEYEAGLLLPNLFVVVGALSPGYPDGLLVSCKACVFVVPELLAVFLGLFKLRSLSLKVFVLLLILRFESLLLLFQLSSIGVEGRLHFLPFYLKRLGLGFVVTLCIAEGVDTRACRGRFGVYGFEQAMEGGEVGVEGVCHDRPMLLRKKLFKSGSISAYLFESWWEGLEGLAHGAQDAVGFISVGSHLDGGGERKQAERYRESQQVW